MVVPLKSQVNASVAEWVDARNLTRNPKLRPWVGIR